MDTIIANKRKKYKDEKKEILKSSNFLSSIALEALYRKTFVIPKSPVTNIAAIDVILAHKPNSSVEYNLIRINISKKRNKFETTEAAKIHDTFRNKEDLNNVLYIKSFLYIKHPMYT